MAENIKPRFEVHKLKGKRNRKFVSPKIERDAKGEPVLNKEGNNKLLGGFDEIEESVNAGWMVYFPNGASVHVWTEEEMKRQGFLNEPSLVNMDTGDDMGAASGQSLKSRSEQLSNRGRSYTSANL
jgi:hypothetical protein